MSQIEDSQPLHEGECLCPDFARWRNYFEWYGDVYSFKRCPFSLQDMVFRRLKANLLRPERIPLADSSEASGNRKRNRTV